MASTAAVSPNAIAPTTAVNAPPLANPVAPRSPAIPPGGSDAGGGQNKGQLFPLGTR